VARLTKPILEEAAACTVFVMPFVTSPVVALVFVLELFVLVALLRINGPTTSKPSPPLGLVGLALNPGRLEATMRLALEGTTVPKFHTGFSERNHKGMLSWRRCKILMILMWHDDQ
jgi:hypothetical protein